MKTRRFENTCVVRLGRGEEAIDGLTRLCELEDIRPAELQAIGAADHAVIGVYDLPARAYSKKELNEFMENTGLLGNVTRVGGRMYTRI